MGLEGGCPSALSTYMGHADTSITLDRYGHLMPGSEEEAAGLLDAYLTGQLDGAVVQACAAAPVVGMATSVVSP